MTDGNDGLLLMVVVVEVVMTVVEVEGESVND